MYMMKVMVLAIALIVFTGQVGSSFVGETEWHKIMTASALVLSTKRFVKLTLGVNFMNIL